MIDILLGVINFLGVVSTIIVLVGTVYGVYLWVKGLLPALWRLGIGLSSRKISIFANDNEFSSLKSYLLDSSLFLEKNIIHVSTIGDVGRAERTTMYLVYWPDWSNDYERILNSKKDSTALIVYSPQEHGFIPKEKLQTLNSHRNFVLSNMRGRLINDIVTSMITSSYDHSK